MVTVLERKCPNLEEKYGACIFESEFTSLVIEILGFYGEVGEINVKKLEIMGKERVKHKLSEQTA